MSSVIITIQSPQLSGAKDLELPDYVPMKQLLPQLVQVLVQESRLPPGHYQLSRRSRVLRDYEAFSDVPVLGGEILTLAPAHAPGLQVGPDHRAAHYSSSSILTTPSDRVIALNNFGKHELLIGRYDPRTHRVPDIDLSDEPQGDTVSRAHALLRRQGDQWFIVPMATRNPTGIGDVIIQPQHSHLLKSGEMLVLGEVQLVFT